ncbi:3-hydroxyacyl-CoA dehydrogenase NAD-binding domain-containing protein [Paenochrobactrum pullorum]|uniref:3-hydroxyacyl-CoA dehydrogenase NAD-binding domain-containing protein n=1 Tax=Paenochrobactrum pullorum TaxID=1324351 RepID=UPI0035BC3CD7
MSVTIARDENIAIVTVDNPPVNALGQALRQGLWDAVEALDQDPQVEAVVLICAGRTFIAGADVREFGLSPQPPHLPDVVAKIENAQKPWIAAIHGSALGGGLEVALGCRFRVAVASASLGLPEVTLGVIPGASGTVRTPRLIGLEKAIVMVTSGKPIRAEQAQKDGLIDAIIDGDLQEGAVNFARSAIKQELPKVLSQRAAPQADEAFWEAQKTSVKRTAKGASAPLLVLESIRQSTLLPFDEAMAFERKTFLERRDSKEAAALRRIFFAERNATKPDFVKDITPIEIKKTAVIGGGTMGAGIVMALSNAGYPVVLVEQDAEAVERGLANVQKIIDASVKRGILSETQAVERLNSIKGTSDYAKLADVDLVIEAVFEKINVKRDVFAKIGQACRADAILATNTSYLDPSDIAKDLPHPERFIGLHFFSPAHVMKLMEIVPTPDTSEPVLATAFAIASKLKKIPVRAGICEGFIGNRILKRYRAAAENLLRKGNTIADIDAAMRGYGLAMGPFEAQDMGGLDIAYLQREGARTTGADVPETLGDILVRSGRKGQKTQGGWYDYVEGERKGRPSTQVDELLKNEISAEQPLSLETMAETLVDEMADEGQAILDEGIALSAVDIDLVKIHGYGFPRWRGGPMFASNKA